MGQRMDGQLKNDGENGTASILRSRIRLGDIQEVSKNFRVLSTQTYHFVIY